MDFVIRNISEEEELTLKFKFEQQANNLPVPALYDIDKTSSAISCNEKVSDWDLHDQLMTFNG